jgi:excisionase family DNA binding protein
MTQSHWLSVEEAATFARVSVPTIRRWLAEEGLTKFQPAGPSGRILIDRDDLNAFLERGSRERYRAHLAQVEKRAALMPETTKEPA